MHLTPIEQAIVEWNISNPVESTALCIAIVLFGIVFTIWAINTSRKNEQARISSERANKRAWIKRNGGL